jgi:hypothetical protein
MSFAQNTFLDIQNILCSIFHHLHCEEHSTVFWEINLFQHQSIQNTIKVSSYENTENNTLNIQHSILGLDMLRIVRLFLQYPFNIFWKNILPPILCLLHGTKIGYAIFISQTTHFLKDCTRLCIASGVGRQLLNPKKTMYRAICLC